MLQICLFNCKLEYTRMPRKKGDPRDPASGRKKGTPNKTTAEVRQMIIESLSAVGGVEYLKEQAVLNPGPYMTLVGKILPKDMSIDMVGGLTIVLKKPE